MPASAGCRAREWPMSFFLFYFQQLSEILSRRAVKLSHYIVLSGAQVHSYEYIILYIYIYILYTKLYVV
jgi:hypothetical protein